MPNWQGILVLNYFVCLEDTSVIYSYKEVNASYKTLFGTNQNAPLKSASMNQYYYYNNGQYISLFKHDDGLWPDGMISSITDYTQDNRSLEVIVSYLYDSKYDTMPAPSISAEEINNMFNSRSDYTYQFKMSFEYEIDHYILTGITKAL